ncbi:efflux RND transporter permease subunit [Pleomorphomonas sp. PLEO]|uniref:efflux RND transporter permease subunit n=1 Tax=Pleomorphomonas sp. PLEO TaxID=3239306 RepID=UPI00351DC3FE
MTDPQSSERASGGFNLSAWALQQQTLVVFLMLMTLAAGAWSYLHLGRNEDPPFTIKTMVVSAAWPGATVTDTANLLTDKIEEKLEETPWLDRLDSYTRGGEAVVMVNLRDETPPGDVANIWYQVRKKVADLAPSLPSGINGPFFDDEFGDTFGTIYAFTAEGFSDRELRDRVNEIRKALLETPDVGKVQLIGAQEEQIDVTFVPAKLAAYGLDPEKIMAALSAQNAVTPAGIIRYPDEKVSLRVSGAFASEESLKAVTLRLGDRFVPLSDLATIARVATDPPSPLFRSNGEKALGLAISMAPTGNITQFGAALKARMASIEAKLPYGIDVHLVADQSKVVEGAVNGFVKVLAEAIVIVLAVSFLSLGTRAGLVVTLSIPLVLALTFVGMQLFGIGLQRISLGALIIALGLLVDDAMITVEAMVSRLELGWEPTRAASYAYESTAFPMLTGTLVTIAGFLPVGFAASSAGEYCYSLFMVVLISLTASWIVAVVFSPLIGTWALPKRIDGAGHGEGRLGRFYGRLVERLLDHGLTTGIAAIALLGLSLYGATKLQQQFFPLSDRPELLVDLTLPQNASLEATDRATRRVEAMLRGDPEVDHFSTYVGSGAIRFYLPMDVLLDNDNISQIVVVAKDAEQRDALRARLETAFKADFRDITARVSQLELGPPVGWPVKYRVTGPDIAKVRDYAMQLANIVAKSPLSRGVTLTSGEPQKAVQVAVNQTEARAVGLSSQDIASTLAVIFSGTTVTEVRDGDRFVPVVVRATPDARRDIGTIANLQITGANGRSIPLRQIATLSYGVEDPIIWRRQREPIITVEADTVAGAEAATVVSDLGPAIAQFRAGLPQGYDVAVGGTVEEADKGNQSILAVVPMMLAVMITLLMLQLRSFTRTTIALLMAPFGLIGVVGAMLPSGSAMGFVAQLGVIALAGMIIRNAVILIQEVETNRAAGLEAREAVTRAARHRSRPILLTALAAILGMLPISLETFWGPMAFAVIGGLTAATVLTLTLLPAVLFALTSYEQRRAKVARPADATGEGQRT